MRHRWKKREVSKNKSAITPYLHDIQLQLSILISHMYLLSSCNNLIVIRSKMQ